MILIAGPCIIESEDILKDTVEKLLEAIEDKNIDFYFKSSFKKDNRTSLDGFRGLPVREALGYLQNIKKEYNVKICTDFHTIGQIDLVKEFDVDIIQIPAFLAKQNSLLEYAKYVAQSENKKLFIKKPQFIGPDDANNIIKNIDLNEIDVFMADRGTMLGYNQVFMDPRHIHLMQESGAKILGDITHPNKNYPGSIYKNIEALGLSYMAAGADGLFLETHTKCEQALCDSQTMLPTKYLNELIEKFYGVSK
ncbi:MAG: hypothetical protein ACOCP4_02260 [Candidatus Woesearchaeota archaeon]